MKEKDETSELEGIEKEFKKAALASRNTFPSKYHEMPFLHDFMTKNSTEFELFLVAAWGYPRRPHGPSIEGLLHCFTYFYALQEVDSTDY